MSRKQFLFAPLLVASCSGGSETTSTPAEYKRMFDGPDPAAVTTDTVTGLWENNGSRYGDVRLRIDRDAIRFAIRCPKASVSAASSSRVYGLTVPAEVTASSIRILERRELRGSVSAGQPGFDACNWISAEPSNLSVCSATQTTTCFRVQERHLLLDPITLFQSDANDAGGTFTKISD